MSASTSLANAIVDYSYRIDDWTVTSHYAVHKSGIAIWIASGLFFIRVERPFEVTFGLWNKWKIKRAMDELVAKKAHALLGNKVA